MTRQEVAQILMVINAEWPDTTISEDRLTIWMWALEDFHVDDVRSAIKKYLRGGKPFAPHPSDLVSLIVDEAVNDDAAELAWIEVQKEVRRIGYNNRGYFANGKHHDPPKPEFSNDLIAKCVESLSWKNVCLGEASEVRKEFIFTYNNLRKRLTHQLATNRPRLSLDDGHDPELEA